VVLHLRNRAWAVIVLLLISTSWSQARREPLTEPEIGELRDAAQDPETRLNLFVKFARTRLTSLEQVRSDPKATDRAQKIHDNLQDFVDIYDELNDNIDTFLGRKSDLRRPLKVVIEGDNEFQAKLRALKSSADSRPAEASAYQFLLTTALDTVDTSVNDHRQLLTAQEEAAKHKKK
jgi:hypothetical protein